MFGNQTITGWLIAGTCLLMTLSGHSFKSEEEFTDQRSSHFRLYVAVSLKSLQKKTCPKL